MINRHHTGVWLNDDGTLGKPDPSNPYRYVGNGPTNATDPTGLAEQPVMQQQSPKPSDIVLADLPGSPKTVAQSPFALTSFEFVNGTDNQIAGSDSKKATTPYIYKLGTALALKLEFTLKEGEKQVSDSPAAVVGSTIGLTGSCASHGPLPAASSLFPSRGQNLAVTAVVSAKENGKEQVLGSFTSGDFTIQGRSLKGTAEVYNFKTVAAYAPLKISLFISHNFQGTLQFVQAIEKRIYVTADEPVLSPGGRNLLEAFVALGCRAAAGESDPTKVFQAIWKEFTTKKVKDVEGNPLKYWGSWDEKEVPTGKNGAAAERLVAEQNGQCGAWAHFFIAVLAAQGLVTVQGNTATLKATNEKIEVVGFAPKVETDGMQNRIVLVVNPNSDPTAKPEDQLRGGWSGSGVNQVNPGRGFKPGGGYDWKGMPNADYKKVMKGKDGDEVFVIGQNNEYPPALFPNHGVVKIGSMYYDPSYGQTYSSLLDFEKKALYGTAVINKRQGTIEITKRSPDTEYIKEIPE